MYPVSAWLAAFVLTAMTEVPIVALALHRIEPNLLRLGTLALFANLATHPIVWFVIPRLLLVGTPEYTLAAEAWAVTAEAVFYRAAVGGITTRRAVGVAIVANAGSFLVGLVAGEVSPELFR